MENQDMKDTVLDITKNAALPFAFGKYTNDWRERASQLSAIGDALALKLRETAFVSQENTIQELRFLSSSPVRKYLSPLFNNLFCQSSISYDVEYKLLSDSEYQIFERLYGDVDSSERIVISACAHALCHLAMPTEIFSSLCNLLYEEALHLESISTLLSIDQSCKEWIGLDKANHWNLISQTNSIAEYLFLEHCLYEGRGFIAAANGAYQIRELGTKSIAYQIAKIIFEQETNHVITGYFWLKQLDDGHIEESLTHTLKSFLMTERLAEVHTFKGKRQRFPLFLAEQYLETRNFLKIRKIITDNAKSIAEKGLILVDDKSLVRSTNTCFNFCGLE